MKRLYPFVTDLIFFMPRLEEEVMITLKEEMVGKNSYSLHEVSFFDKISSVLKLSVDQEREVRKAKNMIKEHCHADDLGLLNTKSHSRFFSFSFVEIRKQASNVTKNLKRVYAIGTNYALNNGMDLGEDETPILNTVDGFDNSGLIRPS